MKKTLLFCMLGSLCLGASGVTQAVASTDRVDVLQSLPDWRGVWQATGSHHYLSGDKNNLPPFKGDWAGKTATADEQDTAERYCAIAVPGLIGSDQPFEMMVTPEQTIVYYASREIRHLWTDGRDHPPEEERWPMFWAESKAVWQGQTLVVDTVEVHGDLWIDATGAKLSDQAQITERYSQLDDDHIQNEVTIVDPVALQKPWRFTRVYQRLEDEVLREQSCEWTAGQAAQ